MKKLLTVLFAGLISTSILMAQETTKSTEQTKTPPAKTKTHKAKTHKTGQTEVEKEKKTEKK
jgi:hypothetical protein